MSSAQCFIYGLETVVSVLFSNTRTRLLYNEREIFSAARGEAELPLGIFFYLEYVISRTAKPCKKSLVEIW